MRNGGSIVSWLRRISAALTAPIVQPARLPDDLDGMDDLFAYGGSEAAACSSCGRTDLPMVGDWDPPICQECDAAINFDAIMESDALNED